MKTYVLYHGNCFDGMASAWAFNKYYEHEVAFGKWRGDKPIFIPVVYGVDAPTIEPDSIVFLLDFSFPVTTMAILIGAMRHVTVIDHHKTAEAALTELWDDLPLYDREEKFHMVFDLEKSGARLTWEFFFPKHEAPPLILYVEDRDLWRSKLPQSEAINAFIQSYPMDLVNYDEVATQLGASMSNEESLLENCAEMGRAISRYKATMTAKMCESPRMVTLKSVNGGSHHVPVVNASMLFSECGDYLCKAHPESPFAAYYFDRGDGIRQWGMRGRGTFDTTTVAKHYGGGGHRDASGFQQPIPYGGTLVEEPEDPEEIKLHNKLD